MRLNTGIITEKLEKTKSFYVNKLGFFDSFAFQKSLRP